jgi:D-alanyl-D-alanine carboxypeptidase
MKNLLLFFCLSLALLFAPLSAQAKSNPRYASIIMDADTGMILEQQYANKSLHPASLTKVMTLTLLFEKLKSGEIGLKDRIRISSHAASMVPSKLGLKPGSSIRVKDAISALVTKSANDVAVAVAEHIGGSERNFARLMNRKAIEMGMTRTTFKNASGLHDKRQVSTARDLAKMARYVINEHPRYYRHFSLQRFTYAGQTYRNHNRLLGSYDGMDGMKTGYVAASGFNLVASAVRNDRRIIAVVLGGRSSKTRNAHMRVLLDRGFSKLNAIRIARADVPIPARKPQILSAIAALNKVGEESAKKLANLNPALGTGFKELIGEGDFDPYLSGRIETGLMAIAAHKGEKVKLSQAALKKRVLTSKPRVAPASLTHQSKQPWSVQIGAFNSRAVTDSAIHKTLRGLPKPFSDAQPVIAPLKTASGWLFRARLTGYTRNEAIAACGYIQDCLTIPPQR